MPLYSRRSAVRMATKVAESLGTGRVNEILGRIELSGHEGVAAEWELFAAFAFSQAGTLSPCPLADRNPEFHCAHPSLNQPAVVEVTAVSDRAAHDRNPYNLFNRELIKKYSKHQLLEQHGFDLEVGSITNSGRVLLALPEKKNISSFFAGAEFGEYLRRVVDNPDERHFFEFSYYGASSSITHRPNSAGYGSGGHVPFAHMTSLEKNAIYTTLKRKLDQIKGAHHSGPAVIVLCNNGSRNWHTVSGSRYQDEVTPEDVVLRFLARTRTVSAVLLWDTLQVSNSFDNYVNQFRYQACSTAILNPRATFQISDALLSSLSHSLQRMPKILRNSINARVPRRYPQFWQSLEFKTNLKGRTQLKLSMKTVMEVLAGQIPVEEFHRAHPEAASWIQDCAKGVTEVTEVSMEPSLEDDDDYIVLNSNTLQSRIPTAGCRSGLLVEVVAPDSISAAGRSSVTTVAEDKMTNDAKPTSAF